MSTIRLLSEWYCNDNISYELQHFFEDIDKINVELLKETIKINSYLDAFFEELKRRYTELYWKLWDKYCLHIHEDEIQDYNVQLMLSILEKYMKEENVLSGCKWKDLVIKEKQKEYMKQNKKE